MLLLNLQIYNTQLLSGLSYDKVISKHRVLIHSSTAVELYSSYRQQRIFKQRRGMSTEQAILYTERKSHHHYLFTMRPFLSIPFLTSSLFLVTASPMSRDGKGSSFNLKPFTVDLSDGVPHMIDLAERTRLPTEGDYFDPNAGISLETLQSLRRELIENFDWNAEQQELNKYALRRQIAIEVLTLT